MNRSTNYNLYLPETSDYRDVSQLSYNFNTLDDVVGELDEYIHFESQIEWDSRVTVSPNTKMVANRNTVIMECIMLTFTDSINGWTTLGTIPSAYRPTANIFTPDMLKSGRYFQFTPSGTILCSEGLTSSDSLRIASSSWHI